MGGETMTDIKPVAMATSSGIYINDEGEALLMLLALKGGKEVLLYTADTLRAAQVAKLRDAADECTSVDDRAVILSMADELEAGK